MEEEIVQVKQPDEIYCPNCAKPISKEAVTCPKCGVQIKEVKENKYSSLSMASLITGILSIFPPLSLWCGIAAIVCGTMDIKRIKRESSYIEGEKFDRIGIITGSIGLCIFAIGIILIASMAFLD